MEEKKYMEERKGKLSSSQSQKVTTETGLHWSLGLVGERCIDHDIRYSVAVNFNIHVKAHWSPVPPVSDSNPIAVNPISDVEKENIKTQIVSVMINANSPKIQSQLSEALYVIIGHHDFPKEWPALLPEIVAHLRKLRRTNDYALINLLLGIVNSLFMKFRCTFKTNGLLVDLKYCVDNFVKPLLEVFERTARLIDELVASGSANAAILMPCIDSQRLCFSIFYSLNFLELHDFFKDNVHPWMVTFKKCLTVNHYDDCGVVGYLLDELRVAVCENISLYVIKEEKLIQLYLNGFVKDVLSLLVCSSSHGNGREQLAVTAIKFLTTVCKSGHHALFSSDYVLQQICESIVIPNVMLQDEEEKLFQTDPIEYIKRDMEGSDIETRRGVVIELLKGIAIHYKDKVREKVRYQIDKCRKVYAYNSKGNWKYKDCAIRLVVSIASKNADETSVSSDMVNVQLFFDEFVVQELRVWDVISFPMMTAGALKFLTLFRNQISNDSVLSVLPKLSQLLIFPYLVVHSYAAICIEKLLPLKDYEARSRYTPDDIRPVLPTLMSDLVHVLSDPVFEENEYVMKCIMRVVCDGDLTVDVASLCIKGLTTILNKVCQNPKSCLFNHYLFESLTALIRRVSVLSKKTRNKIEPLQKKISLVSQLEKKLYPVLQMILVSDIREFFPYAFQLLAELADLNRPLLTKHYTHIFDVFRLPDTWTRSGNFPQTAFQRWALPPMHKLSMIGIYNKLVSSSDTEDYGFNVLNTVVENLGFEVISPFVRNVWISLFNRLQNKRREKSMKKSFVFMSVFLLKDGPRNLVNSVNAVQQNGFQAILEQVWIPNLKLIKGPIQLKLASIASTRLICECPDILDMRLWGKMLDNIMTLLSRRLDTSARIYEAGTKVDEECPLKEIKDPRQYLVESLSNLFATSPQGDEYYHQVISESLEQANQSALLQLFDLNKVEVDNGSESLEQANQSALLQLFDLNKVEVDNGTTSPC